ncbi:MAG TPA: sugar phosphate nucleotidyltransferase [Armatimonadota bacterium]
MIGVRKAVITAGGMGTRHFPATLGVRKEFFPLVDRDGITKPVIQMVVEEAVESGIEEICIVTSPEEKESFRAYFAGPDERQAAAIASKGWARAEAEKLRDLGRRLAFAEQTAPLGYGHAVFCARHFVGDDPFLLLLGDHVYLSETKERCSAQLLRVFHSHGRTTTGVSRTPEEQLHLFGTVAGRPVDGEPGVYQVCRLREKPGIEEARAGLATPGLPEGCFLTFFGQMALQPTVMEALRYHIDHDLREGGEFQLTNALELCRRKEPFLAAEIQGQRLDMGVPEELLRTQHTLALAGPYASAVTG